MKKNKRLTKQQLERNQLAVRNAIAHQRLEGLEISPDVLIDMEKIARGEMTTSDVIRKLYDRYNVPHHLRRK